MLFIYTTTICLHCASLASCITSINTASWKRTLWQHTLEVKNCPFISKNCTKKRMATLPQHTFYRGITCHSKIQWNRGNFSACHVIVWVKSRRQTTNRRGKTPANGSIVLSGTVWLSKFEDLLWSILKYSRKITSSI